MVFTDFFERYGLIIIVLGVFIYWAWIHESRMLKRVSELEDCLREKLVSIIQTTTTTLNTNIETMKLTNIALDEFSKAISKLSSETRKLNEMIKKSPYLVVTAIDRSKVEKT